MLGSPVARSVRQAARRGALLSSGATHSTRVLFLPVRYRTFTLVQSYSLMPAFGDDYAGVTLIRCQSLLPWLVTSS